jgi:hypothetical protein
MLDIKSQNEIQIRSNTGKSNAGVSVLTAKPFFRVLPEIKGGLTLL